MSGAPFVVPGDVIAGKYDVLRVLGAGGMGIVVAARHLDLGHEVAIKFLRPEMTRNQEALERFLREARAAVGLRNEHVARVLDVGEIPVPGGEDQLAPFMVMEMLVGQDLSEVLRRRGRFDPKIACRHVLSACEGLREAHAAGIVHRDIKPSNIFLASIGQREVIKVLDFGVAKAGSSGGGGSSPPPRPDFSLTKTAAIIGSPLYMSPEQHLSAKHVDARTDIWALGATLYELILGIPPFDGTTLEELLSNIRTAPPVPIRSRRPDVDEGLENVITRCLAKDPAARFQTIDDLMIALEPFAAPIETAKPSARPAPASAGLPPPPPPSTSASPSKRRSFTLVAALGGLALLILTGSVGFIINASRQLSTHDDDPGARAPSPSDSEEPSTSASVVTSVSASAPATMQSVSLPPPFSSSSKPAQPIAAVRSSSASSPSVSASSSSSPAPSASSSAPANRFKPDLIP